MTCLTQAFSYIDTNKIPLINRFASFATSTRLHFEHTATSRAEGFHWANIKLHLKLSRGTLLDVYERINRPTERRFALIDNTTNKERAEVLTLPLSVFAPVLRGVTHCALQRVHLEYQKALHNDKSEPCNGYYNKVLGLSCSHDIQARLAANKPLPMSDFHQHWHKEMLVLDPDVDGVLEPLRVENVRGRPATSIKHSGAAHQRNSKRKPSRFELKERDRKVHKCSECKQPGHNRRSCPRVLSTTEEQGGRAHQNLADTSHSELI